MRISLAEVVTAVAMISFLGTPSSPISDVGEDSNTCVDPEVEESWANLMMGQSWKNPFCTTGYIC